MLKIKLLGAGEAIAKCGGLSRSVGRRIIKMGVRAACQFGAKHGRGYVPKRTGLLKKSMGYKALRARRDAHSAGLVGARSMNRNGMNPAKYVHLADQGTKAHRIASKTGKRLAFAAGGRSVVVPTVRHPGAKAQRFMQRILSTGNAGMSAAFLRKVGTELIKEAVKAKPNEVPDGS